MWGGQGAVNLLCWLSSADFSLQLVVVSFHVAIIVLVASLDRGVGMGRSL